MRLNSIESKTVFTTHWATRNHYFVSSLKSTGFLNYLLTSTTNVFFKQEVKKRNENKTHCSEERSLEIYFSFSWFLNKQVFLDERYRLQVLSLQLFFNFFILNFLPGILLWNSDVIFPYWNLFHNYHRNVKMSINIPEET